MGRSRWWVAVFGTGACVVGALVALSIAVPRTPKSSATAAVSVPRGASTNLDEARATGAVVEAANGLTASIARARSETSTVLASSWAVLRRSEATVAAEHTQLAAEQRQIVTEAQQLTARAAALSAESVILQREAATLKAAHAAVATTSPSSSRTFGGDRYDN